LRFTSRFPTGRLDRAQNCVEIIDDERDVYVSDVAWPEIAMSSAVGWGDVFKQFNFMTADVFKTASLSSAPATPVISLAISPV